MKTIMKPALALILTSAWLAAQQPQVENARLEARAFSGSLQAELARSGAGPFWAAWQEPIIPGRHGDMCWSDGNQNEHAAGAPVRLEGPPALLVLVRMENSQVDQLRVASPDCRFDGGSLPFLWLNNVPPAESVAWLKSQVPGPHPDRAIFAIGLHASPAADQALEDLVSPNQPERVRQKAVFWLGSARGAHGVDVLKRVLANDPSENVREQVIFSLAQSRQPAGMAAVFDAAKNDRDAHLRGRALFWIAQKATNKQAQEAIGNAVRSDPDRAVKEQAVFALKQLPEAQGIPLLIDVAKSNPDPAVRKKAMFWLGQSRDPRALDFFAQVLKR
jgi:hypothetical protein